MKISKIVGGGIVAGLVFYGLSLLVWQTLKFLPVVPLAVAVPPQGLLTGWYVEHLLVSLFVGLMWAVGYAVYGSTKAGGWLYGMIIFVVGALPAFVAQFIISAPPVRTVIVYGAVVSLVGALLGGKALALVAKR